MITKQDYPKRQLLVTQTPRWLLPSASGHPLLKPSSSRSDNNHPRMCSTLSVSFATEDFIVFFFNSLGYGRRKGA